MLKRIAVTDLRPGMYLHAAGGSWIESPFWRRSFLIEDPADIARLRAHGVGEVWIDTDRGLDVAVAEPAPAAPEPTAGALTPIELASIVTAPAALADELERAGNICAAARQTVVALFDDARLGRAIVADAVLPVVDDVIASVQRHPAALLSLARLKSDDDVTFQHSVAVCALMAALGRQLGLDPATQREVALGGLLHDIGKVAVPVAILGKRDPLQPEEREAIRIHPSAGERILRAGSGIGDIAREICLHHHERADGSGYPDRQQDGAISSFAMMAAVCDVYDAITADRRYKAGWNPAYAMSRMAGWCEGHFDPAIFRAFVRSVGIYPTGSLVRLRSGRLAVVLEQSPKSLLQPLLKVFYSLPDKARLQAELVDLSAAGADDAIASLEDPRDWSLGDLNALWQLDRAV